jgi:galactarate dehydratase
MRETLSLRVNEHDNVAIMLRDVHTGEEIAPGVTAACEIPQAHKAALEAIPRGGEVIRYGVVIGYALADIPAGGWINERSLELPPSPPLDSMPYGQSQPRHVTPSRLSFLGFDTPDGYAGTRNLLAIHTTVQCVTGVLNVAVGRIRTELLPKYPNVDGVVPVNHAYGCGVAINAPERRCRSARCATWSSIPTSGARSCALRWAAKSCARKCCWTNPSWGRIA